MARKTSKWFLSLQITLYFCLIFVYGNEDVDDAYRNGRNLVLENFLPINLPQTVNVPLRREKRDEEGSGDDESVFSELNEKTNEDVDNSTQNAFAKLLLQGEHEKSSLIDVEGSGEVEKSSESVEGSEEKSDVTVVPIIADTDNLSTTQDAETTTNESKDTSTEMIFDKSEDFGETFTVRLEDTTTEITEPTQPVIFINTKSPDLETTSVKNFQEESTTQPTTLIQETTTVQPETTISEEVTTSWFPKITVKHSEETTVLKETTIQIETTTVVSPNLIPQQSSENSSTFQTTHGIPETTQKPPESITTPVPSVLIPSSTEGLPVTSKPPSTPEPVVEEIFRETKIERKLEALPGNIIQKENLSLAADPLLIANTRLMDSEENVQLSMSEPKRLGAYIVIGLILLSFSSLVGYITFRKRMHRKRREFESNQESNDTEKALLSLSDYKDNGDLEENHLKNNEITPIAVNSQINKFEKNTNFSSPKNLNTIANEKNIEKDNVLKSTAENLTQVIIEDSPKDLEEDKNAPSMEKLIVKTRIDQDSIPKKPIIVNRSSTGYLPIPQDNS